MAYGLRWFNEFLEVDGDLIRVEILQRDYSGAATEVLRAGGTPLKISLAEDATANPFDPIRPTKAVVQWISDEDSNFDIQSLFITDDQEFKLVVKINGDIKWTGFVILSDCQEPYLSKPYPVTIQATCGLAFLDRYEVLDSDGKYFYFYLNLKDAFVGVFSKVGHGFDIEDATNLFSPHSSEIIFGTYKSIIQGTSIQGDGTRGMSCMEFIAGVLNVANSFIVQSEGKWTIQSNRVLTEAEFDRIVFNDTFGVLSEGKVNKTVELIDPADSKGFGKLRPTPSVIEKLAQPKSKIKINIRPGVQYNRLINGSFVPIGDDIPGWEVVNTVPIASFSIVGEGTPLDPYMLYYKAFLGTSPSMQRIVPNEVELNIGDVNVDNAAEYNIGLRFSGTIKAENLTGLQMMLRVNYGERDWVDYMLTDGSWDDRKPAKNGEARFNVSTPVKAGFFTRQEIESSTFEFESKPIKNWILRSGNWLSKIQLRIDKKMSSVSGRPPSIWLQDFVVTIDSGTAYERDHSYEIDATKVILNGEEYSYDVTVADKINIDTLEQKRPENRVMTGYMSFGYELSNDWTRIVNGVADPLDPTPKPLQYLSLKERIRLLCGKRSILEGVFIGKGLWPDSRITNAIEPGRKPMMVTNWEWDVKNNQYRATFFELDFTPLPNEEILLVEEEKGGTGRRTRAGGGSSGTGTLPGRNPIKIDELPGIFGAIKRPIIWGEDVAEYLISYQDVEMLTLRPLAKPSWATVTIQEDTLEIEITGIPDQSGDDQVLVEVSDGSGDEYIITIPIRIFPAPSLTYTISPGGKLIPSQPVTLPHTPPYTLTVQAKGGHDAYRWVHRFAGAVQYDSDIIPVSYTENAIYTPISAESLAQGIHVVFFQLFRQTGVDENDDPIYTVISGDDLIFKLGTAAEDPDRTVKLELVSGGATLGEIPNTFEYIEEWDIRPTPKGIRYDELFLSILPEEEPYTNTLTPTLSPAPFALEPEILDGSDGTTSPDAGYVTTDAISVSPGQEYWLESAPYSAVGYNSGSYVTELSGEVIIIPAGVNQDRICWANGSITEVNRVEITGTLFGGDAPKGAGNFTVFARAFLAGSQVYERMENFTILEKEPAEPVEQEGITLIQPGNPLVILVDPIPMEGLITTLPPSFGLLFSGFGTIPYDKITWKLFHGMAGMSEVSLPLYTGQASEKSYNAPVTAATQLLFWGKTSLDMGNIHQAPNRLLVEVTGWLKGSKVAVAKADWIFSNTPIGPGSGMAYGYYDPVANDFSLQVSNVPTTGGIYPLLDLEERDWVVGSGTWNSSTQYNKRETEVNGIIVKTWTGALTATNTNLADFLSWNRSTPGLDEPGDKTIIERFYNGAALIGTKQVVITLYSKDPDIKDPNECCTGGGNPGGIIEVEFSPASTLWVHNHGLGYEASGIPVIDNEEWATKITFSPDKNTTYYHWNSPRAGKIVLTL